jgi:hypothetical protein
MEYIYERNALDRIPCHNEGDVGVVDVNVLYRSQSKGLVCDLIDLLAVQRLTCPRKTQPFDLPPENSAVENWGSLLM